MPASKHGDVQTDNYDGRKFITMGVSSNAEPAYRKLYLRTKNHPTARRRAALKTPSLKMEAAAQFVFTYDDGRPFNQEQSFGVTKLFRQLRKDEKAGKWQIRHLRNIGSTLCRDAHLPTNMATAWLGHSAGGTNKFYMGEAKEDYLEPLVKVIGRRYFR